ncbi:hypothetical protein C2G38_2227877 [Gigaspora rosea]|uniref:HNH nuclease domain-containing protein n=1 Tax=Gigaspora rosea TaxID=44941 RepID=A0A397TWX8_9GLOM|nr:hypothetical protein C2G38_2227877 [Gigaspora rosea]
MSNWRSKFENFEVITSWEKYKNPNKPRLKLNEYCLVKINFKLYLEVKTQKLEITFLTDLKYFNLIQNHTWYCSKLQKDNTYYVKTNIKNKNILFHKIIYPNYKIIDHILRNGLDNRNINLRETTYNQNGLNCKLSKNNTSGYNGISKYGIYWLFQWFENKKHKVKYFKTKQLAIEFKLKHNKITGNQNGYPVNYI